jgi:predicted Rossmann fold flavoprotein
MGTIKYNVIFAGGGAASFFAALRLASLLPSARIAILEKGKEILQKVRISGGGRCNVTNVITDPKELSAQYPRGYRELLGPFYSFSSKDTVEWFGQRGVRIKAETDGRMFPETDDSTTIIDCLLREAKRFGIEIIKSENLLSIKKRSVLWWELKTHFHTYDCQLLFIGTGSNPRIWEMLKSLGLHIIEPVPSLFTFNIKHPLLRNLAGISLPDVSVLVAGTKLSSSGPILITHWGLSGPAILRLSAWGALELAALNYSFEIVVDWLPGLDSVAEFRLYRQQQAKKQVSTLAPGKLPSRFWRSILEWTGISVDTRWADLNKEQLNDLVQCIHSCSLPVKGKSTFKEEFVTAGGVALKEIDFKQFCSRKYPDLFMAGEVLNIDGITGGFNFQAAWTGGWIAGTAMAEKLEHAKMDIL